MLFETMQIPQLSFNKTTSFTAPSLPHAPTIVYPRLHKNVMPLRIPGVMPAKSAWTNTFIVNSQNATGLTLTVTTSQSSVKCDADAIALAAAAKLADASTSVEETAPEDGL
jgi:hypothetical protein